MARNIYIDPKDLDALSRVAYAEAATINDPRKYSSVADSIVNRTAAGGWFGGDVQSVINKPKQYTPVNPYGSWTGLNKAPANVETDMARHMSERAFGAPSTVGDATHYLNPSVPSTAFAKKTWAKEFGSWPSVGFGKLAHVFGAPDTPGGVPEHTISLSPQIQAEMSGVYDAPDMVGGGVFGSLPSTDPSLSYGLEGAPVQTQSIASNPAGSLGAPVMGGSLAGFGPQTSAFDSRYSNPGFDTVDTRPSDAPLSTPFGAPSAAPDPYASDMAMSAARAAGQMVGGMAQMSDPTYGLRAQAERLSTPGSPVPAGPVSAPQDPGWKSVNTVSVAGLSPSQIGEAPQAAPMSALDNPVRQRIDQAFGQFAPGPVQGPQALAATPATVNRIDQAFSQVPSGPVQTVDALRAPSLPSPMSAALTPSMPSPMSPAQSFNALSPEAMNAPPGMMGALGPMAPGAMSPMQSQAFSPTQVASVAPVSAPQALGAPAMPMARPPSMMATPAPAVTVAAPAGSLNPQTQQDAQQTSVAPAMSPTAGMTSAGDFARANAMQIDAKKAAVNSAGPEKGGLMDSIGKALGFGGNKGMGGTKGGSSGGGGSSSSGGGSSGSKGGSPSSRGGGTASKRGKSGRGSGKGAW